MLKLTGEAARAIRELTGEPDTGGVRIHAGPRFRRGQTPAIQVEIVRAADVEDLILEAEGARLYLEPETFEALDDKLLDAKTIDDEIRFALFDQRPDDAQG